jgi:hypothetical protein
MSISEPGKSNVPVINVTDALGSYMASFSPPPFSGAPSTLVQTDLQSDQATVWQVDPTTNQIVGPPHQTGYTSQTIQLGPNTPNAPPPPKP